MASESTLRFSAQTDEVTSLLRIVNMVRTGEAMTRPEIGRITGLGRGVVTQRIDQAIEMGFLADSELAPSTGGRSARTLRFRSEQGLIVVCALGALHIRVGIADLDGTLIAHTHEPWDIASGPEKTLARTMEVRCPADEAGGSTGLGRDGRPSRPGGLRARTTCRAADHAGVERFRRARRDPGALRRPRLDRQRRQPARLR